MEQGRFKQITDLKAQGWKRNYKLLYSHPDKEICGDSSIMENPEGLIYAVGCGKEILHTGPLYEKFTGNAIEVENGKIITQDANSKEQA